MAVQSLGTVITFYSYKGGTGRTMALANVACLLAQRQIESHGKGVLMVDWDLEAPGLHRFFHNRLELSLGEGLRGFTRPGRSSDDVLLEERPGLIDLFLELDQSSQQLQESDQGQSEEEDQGQSEEEAIGLIKKLSLERFVVQTTVPGLSLLAAGRFDENYSSRVNTFQWEALYNRSPYLIPAFAERLAEDYEYVLIDSRTGLSDVSGICTMLMPSTLVVVFTPNRQSLTGLQNLIRRATTYRKQSSDLRPLIVFPLASRIETAEKDLRERWRFGTSEADIVGYQRHFESLFEEVYGLPDCDLTEYFDDAVIQHVPRYAYGEEIAVLTERAGDRLSLTRTYLSFSQRLIEQSKPWEKHPIAAELGVESGELKRLSGRESTSRLYPLTAIAGLIIAVGLLIFYIYDVPKLVESSAQNQRFYFLLIPWAAASAASFFGVVRTYTRFTHKRLGSIVEMGGPVALFCLVLIGGFTLVPKAQSFDLSIRAFGPTGPVMHGAVTVDLGNDRRTVAINASGEAILKGIPQKFWGTNVPIFIQADGYEPSLRRVVINRYGLEIPIDPQKASLTILRGFITPLPPKKETLRIIIDGQPGASTVPDQMGTFRLRVTGKDGDRVRLMVYDAKQLVYDEYIVLPGPVTVKLPSPKPQSKETNGFDPNAMPVWGVWLDDAFYF